MAQAFVTTIQNCYRYTPQAAFPLYVPTIAYFKEYFSYSFNFSAYVKKDITQTVTEKIGITVKTKNMM